MLNNLVVKFSSQVYNTNYNIFLLFFPQKNIFLFLKSPWHYWWKYLPYKLFDNYTKIYTNRPW